MDSLTHYWMTVLRDKSSDQAQFQQGARAISRLLVQRALQHLPTETFEVQTPLGPAEGLRFPHRVIIVPILRAGLSMLPAFQDVFPSAPVGVIGLRRDEKTAVAELYYENFPEPRETDRVLIVDPMLATGGTLVSAIELLTSRGVLEENIIFCGIVGAPEGLNHLQNHFPKVKTVIAAMDDHLNDDKFIVPGLGDFGDRYFGTT